MHRSYKMVKKNQVPVYTAKEKVNATKKKIILDNFQAGFMHRLLGDLYSLFRIKSGETCR